MLEFGSVFGALGNRIASSFGFKSTGNFKMLTGYSVSVGSLLAFILRVCFHFLFSFLRNCFQETVFFFSRIVVLKIFRL